MKRASRELQSFSYLGKGNSMHLWYRVKNPLVIVWNFLIVSLCRVIPSLALKNVLYRGLGMRIGRNVSISLGVMFDFLFPELIEIGDNTIIGYNTTILAHEFLVNEWRVGKVVIGRNVMIGANSTVIAGVTVGNDSTVSACSLVNRNVRSFTSVEGVPIRAVER